MCFCVSRKAPLSPRLNAPSLRSWIALRTSLGCIRSISAASLMVKYGILVMMNGFQILPAGCENLLGRQR